MRGVHTLQPLKKSKVAREEGKPSLRTLFRDFQTAENRLNRLKREGKNNGYCPQCKSDRLESTSGVVCCFSCGCYIEDELEKNQEWGGDGEMRCVYVDDNLPETSYSAGVSFDCPKGFSSNLHRDIVRLNLWNTASAKERAKKDRLENMELIAYSAGLSQKIVEQAKDIFSTADDNINIKHRSNNNLGIQAAAFYYSCQNDGNTRKMTIPEIAEMFDIENKYVIKGLRVIKKYLSTGSSVLEGRRGTVDDLFNYTERLGLDREMTNRCISIYHKIEKLDIMDQCCPRSLCSGIISYMLEEQGVSGMENGDIAKVCEVSVPTVKKITNKLMDYTLELST